MFNKGGSHLGGSSALLERTWIKEIKEEWDELGKKWRIFMNRINRTTPGENVFWKNRKFCIGNRGIQSLKSQVEKFELDRLGKGVHLDF